MMYHYKTHDQTVLCSFELSVLFGTNRKPFDSANQYQSSPITGPNASLRKILEVKTIGTARTRLYGIRNVLDPLLLV